MTAPSKALLVAAMKSYGAEVQRASGQELSFAEEYAFEAGYNAAYERGLADAESSWTPIADIPEEWKDGREVDLWVKRTAIFDENIGIETRVGRKSSLFLDGKWGGTYKGSGHIITHAMLPPAAPKGKS